MGTNKTEQIGWDVYSDGIWQDTVFFSKWADADYVRESLINHDGYDPSITVKQEKN